MASAGMKERPVAVETEPVHSAAGAERQRVTRLVDDTGKGIGAGDSGQAVLRTMTTMDQVREVPLRERHIISLSSLLGMWKLRKHFYKTLYPIQKTK